jgi:hypothetical protein
VEGSPRWREARSGSVPAAAFGSVIGMHWIHAEAEARERLGRPWFVRTVDRMTGYPYFQTDGRA